MAVLRRFIPGSTCFDPAQDFSALAKWKHLEESVSVDRLLFTHGNVAKNFGHGPHQGCSIHNLTQDLIGGKLRTQELTPLVVAKLDGAYHVVFGNRRLRALKDFSQRFSQRCRAGVAIRCFIHDLGNPLSVETGLEPFIAKFLLSWTTTNGGHRVHIRRA